MIKLFAKEKDRQISKNITLNEIKCRCKYNHCRHVIVVDVLNDCFERLRMLCGDNPLYFNSGNRCSAHNLEEGGAELSMHLLGFALDIKKPNNITWQQFIKFCNKAGFSMVIPYKESGFVHCDIRGLI